MKTRVLVIAGFLASLAWLGYLLAGLNGQVRVDVITVSALVVTVLSVAFSLLSWFLFSWASKNISFQGTMLSVTTGVIIIIPFMGSLGPMAGILVGIVGGFAAYMIGQKITTSKNKFLVIGLVSIATSYAVLSLLIFSVQTTNPLDTEGKGIYENETVVYDTLTPESNFSQRYHVSIFQNAKTAKQYVTPDFITIGPGEKVTWSNYDKIPHTIISSDPENKWGTGVILPEGYSTITFDETGIYEYHGKPGTNGIIVVMNDDGQLLESKFSEVFGPGSPLAYKEGLEPVFLYDNCKRYTYWLNEYGHENIHVPEDYPRYPPWGAQIFPLVEFCVEHGELAKIAKGDSFFWEFKVENKN